MKVSAYISTELKHNEQIKKVRDWMFKDLNVDGLHGDNFYKKVSPHITVIPPFSIEQDKVHDLKCIVRETNINNKAVKVNGAAVWPNLRTPYVVMLDVDVDLQSERKDLIQYLDQIGVTNYNTPVDPHITLFKTTGWWDRIPDTTRHKIQNQVYQNRVVKDTEITEAKLIVN